MQQHSHSQSLNFRKFFPPGKKSCMRCFHIASVFKGKTFDIGVETCNKIVMSGVTLQSILYCAGMLAAASEPIHYSLRACNTQAYHLSLQIHAIGVDHPFMYRQSSHCCSTPAAADEDPGLSCNRAGNAGD